LFHRLGLIGFQFIKLDIEYNNEGKYINLRNTLTFFNFFFIFF
jgi:hypothetical protein